MLITKSAFKTIKLHFRVGEDVVVKKPEEEREKRQQIKDQDTTWYHEGPPSLLDARLFITGINFIVLISILYKIKWSVIKET